MATKVKQDMIDFIKTQGMTRALKRAGQINAKGTKGEAEFIEGVRRMYGDRRLAAATKTATPAKKGSYQAGSAKAGKATYTTGSGVSRSTANKTVTKPAAKAAGKGMSGTTKRNLIGGALLAGGAIAAKATPAGRAISGAVGLGKAVAGAVGRKTATKALSTSGRAAAAVKRPVSQSQYDAMKKAASAPKKLVKTKAAVAGAGAVTMVPKPKKK